AEWWKKIRTLAGEQVKEIHRDHPEQLGLPIRDLRTMMEPELPGPRFFDMVLEGLLAGEFAKAGPNIRHEDHVPQLPPELKQSGELVRRRLSSDLITPPNKGEAATNPNEEKALRFLVHTGEVVDLDAKTVISSEGFGVIRKQVCEYLEKHGRATASDLRQHTGTVRRILMPLLERLDEMGVTKREGDERRLR
ncbi:MAG: SelB C-terminal domain-containing protein, partial [Verrucomicrobiota bacterium]